jgi:hypothetical protein
MFFQCNYIYPKAALAFLAVTFVAGFGSQKVNNAISKSIVVPVVNEEPHHGEVCIVIHELERMWKEAVNGFI